MTTETIHQLSTEEWIEILKNDTITKELDLSLFHVLYTSKNYRASASSIGSKLGYKGKYTSSPLNSEIGRYAKRIAKYYDINFSIRKNRKYKFWDLFFNGHNEGQYFIWELKPEIIEALEASKVLETLYCSPLTTGIQ